MSTHSDESDVTAKHEDTAQELEEEQEEDMPGSNGSIAESFSRTRPPDGDDESAPDSPAPELNGTSFQGYSKVNAVEEDETDIPSSPTLSPFSTPTDSPPSFDHALSPTPTVLEPNFFILPDIGLTLGF